MTWNSMRLGDALKIKHGFAFKSQYFSDIGKYVVLTPANFYEEGGFRLRPNKDRYYIGDIPAGYVLKRGDLIIPMTEQAEGLLGSPATVPEDDKYLHNQRLGLVHDLDESKLDQTFLYYLFNTRAVRGQVSASASGTKVRHTAPERVYRVRVVVPPVNQQSKVGRILARYDELIENNRRRIQLLEESAQLLYREWFVHLRFPGHEHVKVVDGVPEGWTYRSLRDVADVTMGQSPKSEFYNEDGEGLPFHQGVSDFGDRFVEHRVFCTVQNRLAQAGDILCSVRAPVGRLNVTLDPIVIGRGLAAIREKNERQSHLFYQLRAHFFREDLFGSGAIFAAINKKELEGQELLRPPDRLIDDFEEFASTIGHQIATLHKQNQRLSQARNLLLPRLMNGEIAV